MCEESALINMDQKQENYKKIDGERPNIFKIIRRLASACSKNKINFKQIKALKEKHEMLRELEILNRLDETCFDTPQSKLCFKKDVLREVLRKFYEECDNDKIDLWFLGAATCNLEKLKEIARDCDIMYLCRPRHCDSALVFSLKYGNILDVNFLECVNILLGVGISVNEPDFNGRTALDIVCELYEDNKNDEMVLEKFKKLVSKLLEQDVYQPLLLKKTKKILQTFQQENKNSISQIKEQHNSKETEKLQLFAWIGKERTQELLRFRDIRNFVDCDNGEYTLLQFACKKSEKMHPVVKFLVDNGANINNVTEVYNITPLEVAAKNNYERSFEEILKNKNLKITQRMFNNFVKWRSCPMKLKIFDLFLESDKLDPNFTYETTGNTPLHYATRFRHKVAIQKLLKRSPQTLFVENKNGKTALDITDAQDLEKYFDSCVALDRYAMDFSANDYKMLFRFKSLINSRNSENDEVAIVSRISKRKHLEQLLTHPLIHTFIVLKWSKIEKYYWMILFLQGLLFLALSVCFYCLSDSSQPEFNVCIFFTSLNFVLKLGIVFGHRCWIFNNLRMLTMYECGEVLLMLTLFGSFFSAECRAFAFIEMSLLFLLTVGYHPKIAKWSVMLKKVFESFTLLMIFFTLIIIAFAAAFHVLFKDTEHKFFTSIGKSIFITYVMITGEFNIGEVDFKSSNIGGYILFFIFAIFMALVIVNFWTGVAVTDIGTIQQDADVNAFKNVITFMAFVERRIYANKIVRKFLPCSFLFVKTETEKYEVDFYINKKNQFEGRKNFPTNVGQNCLEKIKNFNSRRQSDLDAKNILLKLEEVTKILNEVKKTGIRNENYLRKKTDSQKIGV
ncbi:transient receptor potential cation channel protein painless-like [Zophobas morio]|uniref:transient receptor potential cation channel protein painless-like n=1 Tax=Zophobas morio TaxID=2755281 RepID=UPI003082A870